MTLNKALPGDNPMIKKNPSLLKKIIRAYFWYSMELWVFLIANPFRLRLKRTKDMRHPGTWELFQLYTGYSLVIEHTLKGTPAPRTWHLVFRHTKVQAWGMLVSKSLQLLFKEYPSLWKDQLWLTDRKKIYRKKKNDEWVKKNDEWVE